MRETDKLQKIKEILETSKHLGFRQNVSIRVLDKDTGRVVSESTGHNSVTNSLITGIGHYLVGEGVYNQGYEMLHKYIPLYISLGTMGLLSQEEDSEGLPADLGGLPDRRDVDDEKSLAILERWEAATTNLELIQNGYQHVNRFGDTLLDENGNEELEYDLDKYIYPPDNTVQGKRQILDRWGYMPKVEYCIYYVDMIDKGQKDEHGDTILEPDVDSQGKPIWSIAKGTKGLNSTLQEKRQCPYAEPVQVRLVDGEIQVVKGRYVDPLIAAEYDSKYNKDTDYTESIKTIEGRCILRQKCLDCVFPEKKALIDALQNVYDEWVEDLTAAQTEYDEAYDALEELRFNRYLDECPGFGADGSCENGSADNNYRPYFGLGPTFANRESKLSIDCELISETFPRELISYREIVPESESELKNTIDVVFSAMISTGALKQFREPGKDYIFITEAGLWSDPDWNDSGENGLLAGYRIVPPNRENWDMSVPENRRILKQNILKVGINQVVQVIWKIQIGGVDEFEGMRDIFSQRDYKYSTGMLFGHIPTHFPFDPNRPDAIWTRISDNQWELIDPVTDESSK